MRTIESPKNREFQGLKPAGRGYRRRVVNPKPANRACVPLTWGIAARASANSTARPGIFHVSEGELIPINLAAKFGSVKCGTVWESDDAL
jgi:hypothetical protein